MFALSRIGKFVLVYRSIVWALEKRHTLWSKRWDLLMGTPVPWFICVFRVFFNKCLEWSRSCLVFCVTPSKPNCLTTLLEKRWLHPEMRYPFSDYSYSICLWDLKPCWWAESFAFLCIACTILFNMYFSKLVMTSVDIGEICCMSIPKCRWRVIVVNLIKQTWFFVWCCLLVWFCTCWVSIGYSRL